MPAFAGMTMVEDFGFLQVIEFTKAKTLSEKMLNG